MNKIFYEILQRDFISLNCPKGQLNNLTPPLGVSWVGNVGQNAVKTLLNYFHVCGYTNPYLWKKINTSFRVVTV